MSDKKTIEDILRHLYVTAVQDADGVRADRKGYHMRYDEVPAQAKQAIQALITEARVDEVKRIDPTSDYVLNDLVMSVGDRLTQLKKGLSNE